MPAAEGMKPMTRRSSRILVLNGTSRLLMKAEGLGLDIVNLRSDSNLDEKTRLLCSAVHVVDFSRTGEVLELVRGMHRDQPFERVICHAESLQVLAAFITDEFDLPGNSFHTARLLSDKYALRSRLRSRGLSRAASAVIADGEQLAEFISVNGPTVVKPRNGSGSWGVHFLNSANEAGTVWDAVTAAGLKEMLAEVLLVGPEISVEAFSIDGRHYPLSVTTKEKNGFIELGHAVPAPLGHEDSQACYGLVQSLLDAVDLRWGASHTEIIFTSDGPEVVESHSRRGGGHINELVRLVYGIDMEELMFQLAAGDEVSLQAAPHAQGAAAIRFLTAPAGTVCEVRGVEEVSGQEGVSEVEAVSSGHPSHGLRWSGDYLGHVITRADTADAAMERATRLSRLIEFDVHAPADKESAEKDLVQQTMREALDMFDITSLSSA
ncbi:ATP-grasp domain-containing protein [Streptomyces sp. BF23-18]|uniref:ATP-grasp domain-containing protein n=1 Tax=Streptomyces sp. BF23-18 TaxID=3240282 RepID=UPI0034E52C65